MCKAVSEVLISSSKPFPESRDLPKKKLIMPPFLLPKDILLSSYLFENGTADSEVR